MRVNKGFRHRSVSLMKHKRLLIGIILALIGAIGYAQVAHYTRAARLERELQVKQQQIKIQLDSLQSKDKLNADQQKTIDQLNKEKDQLNKLLQAKRSSAVAYAEAVWSGSSSHSEWMSAAGIPPSQWGCTDYIISRESGWRVTVQNSIGAYGLPQSLPANKMASAGADWQTNPVTQLKWFLDYTNSRYGSPCGAYNFWLGHSWY